MFRVAHRGVGKDFKPFIIAEVSANHGGSIERAKQTILAAKNAGADAIKIQTYRADTITLNARSGLFEISDKNSLWYGRNLYELYEEAHTPWEWHREIFDLANELGMLAFSSPFDETAVDYLESLNVPAYKIASFESNHFPLLKKVAQTGKPILISSGTSKINELYESVQYLKANGAKDIVVFKCTSTYPASPENTNLNTIPVFQSIFEDCVIGLSDHTMGIGASVAAIALGARVIEKHFTLDRLGGGPDDSFSIEPEELKALCRDTATAKEALGSRENQRQDCERGNMQFRRSLYVTKNMVKGELFSPTNTRSIRPAMGLAPKYYDAVLGSAATKDIEAGTPLDWNLTDAKIED